MQYFPGGGLAKAPEIIYIQERKDIFLARQIAYQIKSTTGPPEVRK